jgi:hypothetical protein
MRWYAGENLPRTHAKPTFSESWFHHYYGFTFGEKYSSDPIFRTEQDRRAKRLLFQRFGDVGLGSQDPLPHPHLDICGHRFASALLGCPVVYQEDQPPAVRRLRINSPEELSTVRKPDLETHHWAREFLRQGRLLLERYGCVDATINFGGPLNVATSAVGTDFFTHLIDSPPQAQQFLNMLADLCLECFDKLTLPLNPELDPGRELFIGECPVSMLSPEMYHEQVLPADLRLRRNARKLGLHHCGNMDGYLCSYRTLEPLEYIEVGWGSTVSAVRQTFPATVLDLMINVYDVCNMPASGLRDVITSMIKEGSPKERIRDVWVADIGPDVPDQVVIDFVEAVNAAFNVVP